VAASSEEHQFHLAVLAGQTPLQALPVAASLAALRRASCGVLPPGIHILFPVGTSSFPAA